MVFVIHFTCLVCYYFCSTLVLATKIVVNICSLIEYLKNLESLHNSKQDYLSFYTLIKYFFLQKNCPSFLSTKNSLFSNLIVYSPIYHNNMIGNESPSFRTHSSLYLVNWISCGDVVGLQMGWLWVIVCDREYYINSGIPKNFFRGWAIIWLREPLKIVSVEIMYSLVFVLQFNVLLGAPLYLE